MKLIHLSDLHLGKRVNEYSMLEDQEYILDQIIRIIDEEAPDAVLIAGDVYDKSTPSAEAVALFDRFLVMLSKRDLKTFVISGNHDSPERIAFGSRLMEASNVFMSPVYDGTIPCYPLSDAFGTVNLYLLPFIKPSHVRRYFGEESIASYTDAIRTALSCISRDPDARNVLVTHQFVTGASRRDSEEVSVGGSDNIDESVFEGFDYVALGHIHTSQPCGSDRIRYCGTPLKYSFSESKDKKSVTVIDLKNKGELSVSFRPLCPLHDLVELKGSYEEISRRSFYEHTGWQEDYTHITLTDEEDVPDAIGKLRTIYHRLMKLDYDNTRTQSSRAIDLDRDMESKSPFELFSAFYEQQNNQPMSEEQENFMRELTKKVWEETL